MKPPRMRAGASATLDRLRQSLFPTMPYAQKKSGNRVIGHPIAAYFWDYEFRLTGRSACWSRYVLNSITVAPSPVVVLFPK